MESLMKARGREIAQVSDASSSTDGPFRRIAACYAQEGWVLGSSPAVSRVLQRAEAASQAQCTVLISGETGTGKEVWAHLIHKMGARSKGPFVPVNCAALTPTLAESQLFGHEKGAFTGAAGASLGVFRAAHGGVIFLDEVGEMPMELQPKLLRVLQQREVTPVGASTPVPIDVQVIAATNRGLEREVAEGSFRQDLYYRLNMCEAAIPALRECPEDIPTFLEFFSKRFANRYGRPLWSPDPETLKQFCEYPWPGNIRQLAHVIEQSYVLDTTPTLPAMGERVWAESSLPFYNLGRLREAALRQALRATRGHKGRAAKLLGVHANTVTRMLASLDSEDTSEGTASAAR
jgi:DNA-binding NtrC family response regulator